MSRSAKRPSGSFQSVRRRWQRAALILALAVGPASAMGCGDDADTTPSENGENGENEGETRHGLTPAQQAEVLAEVGEETITLGEFADQLADQSPYLRARFNTPERRREFLDNLIRFELLAQEAERRGIDEDPSVVRTRNRAMIQQMMRTLFEDELTPEDISDEDIAAYYEAHQNEFHNAAQMRASVVVFDSREAAAAALADLQAHPEDGDRFRQLAAEQGDPDRAARRGDLGFFGEDGVRGDGLPTVPSEAAAAAFQLSRIGSFAPAPVQVGEAFWLLRLTGKRPALERSIEDASRSIRQRLWAERRDEAVESFVAELRGAADVEVDEEALAHVRIPEAVPSPAPSENPPADNPSAMDLAPGVGERALGETP